MSTRLSLALAFLCSLTAVACASTHEREPLGATPERSSSASLAIDERGLYWVDGARESVMHAAIGGGEPYALASAHPSLYAPIALTPTEVVWGDRASGHVRVMRAPREGGAASIVAEGNGGPIGIGVGHGRVYFSREEDTFDLLEVDLSTSRERLVALDMPALGIVVDGSDLLVARCAAGGLARVPIGGGAPRMIAATYCPIALALDGADLFFSDYAAPTNPGAGGLGIFTVAAGGGVATRVTLSDGLAFAIHRGAVYTATAGEIVRVTRDGQTTPIARASGVVGIAVDDELVYWTEMSSSGAITLMFVPH